MSNEEVKKAFKQDSGRSIDKLLNRSILEQMIDEATGYDKCAVAEFIVWVTGNFWNSLKECGHVEAYQKAKNDLVEITKNAFKE